jgi:autotransporter adhesin
VVATNGTGAFNLANTNGLVAPGTLGVGQIAATGAGVRMLWYPRKGAFRAGQVTFDQWDDATIGNFSVAMGQNTRATGASSVVLGDSSSADGTAGVALGGSNHAMGNNSVALGFASSASAATSFAMGHGAMASGRMSVALGTLADTNLRDGAFVYGDRSTLETTGEIVQATTNNEFVVRASGGFRFRTSPTLSTGCNLPAGSGTWSCTSTRTAKHLFQDVNGEDLLVRLRRVPVSTWSYLSEEGGVRHMGPFAEDFRAAFGLGVNDVSIGLQDIDGVNMAAVQALVARTDALQRDNAAQAARIKELEAEMAVIRSLLLRSGVRR